MSSQEKMDPADIGEMLLCSLAARDAGCPRVAVMPEHIIPILHSAYLLAKLREHPDFQSILDCVKANICGWCGYHNRRDDAYGLLCELLVGHPSEVPLAVSPADCGPINVDADGREVFEQAASQVSAALDIAEDHRTWKRT